MRYGETSSHDQLRDREMDRVSSKMRVMLGFVRYEILKLLQEHSEKNIQALVFVRRLFSNAKIIIFMKFFHVCKIRLQFLKLDENKNLCKSVLARNFPKPRLICHTCCFVFAGIIKNRRGSGARKE